MRAAELVAQAGPPTAWHLAREVLKVVPSAAR